MNERPEFHYLVFSKRERRAILIWVLLIATCKTIAYVYEDYQLRKNGNPRDWIKLVAAIDSIETIKTFSKKNFSEFEERSYQRHTLTAKGRKPVNLFEFDPNTASDQEWSTLGVSDKTISGIKKYLSKGGRFRTAEDLRKIWGITDDHATALIPYARIEFITAKANDRFINKSKPSMFPGKIDINMADSSEWEALPGIGTKLASRITRFRERLGGFYSVEQVSETFGLEDSTFKKIKPYLTPGQQAIKKIAINDATAEQLKSHPYIRYQLANVIIQFRNQHGAFKDVEDLRKIMIITEEQYRKIKPYITVETLH